jgi:hypothetical protein
MICSAISTGWSIRRRRSDRPVRKTVILRQVSPPGPGHKIYPYLLRGVEVTQSSQVWAMDIT